MSVSISVRSGHGETRSLGHKYSELWMADENLDDSSAARCLDFSFAWNIATQQTKLDCANTVQLYWHKSHLAPTYVQKLLCCLLTRWPIPLHLIATFWLVKGPKPNNQPTKEVLGKNTSHWLWAVNKKSSREYSGIGPRQTPFHHLQFMLKVFRHFRFAKDSQEW